MILVCPTEQDLSALLTQRIDGETLDSLEVHLQSCESCRQQLDSLTNSPMITEWMRVGDASPRAFPYLSSSDRPSDLGRIGRYRVITEIGRGGMGIVFQAWDDELRRAVALKVLRIGQDETQAAERFAREARAACRVQHDHVVPVLDVIRTGDGRPAIVMPLITGPTLRDRIRAETVLTARDAAKLIREVADGLAAIHKMGIIHRDVKPSNILLDRSDDRAKLTDFGLSRDTTPGDTLTREGTIVGTPEYLSPEQAIDASRLEGTSDIYSLGITLYECLTGVVPFRGAMLDVLAKHRTDDPVPIRRLTSSVPADLETICLKCLEKQPHRRYSQAVDLREELDRWLSGRPILARRAGPLERSVRWSVRNPWPVVLLAVFLIGFVAATAGWWRASVHSHRADDRTKEAMAATTQATLKSKLADDRALLALNTINTLVTKSQNLIGNTPGTLELKKQLNEAALADLRKLAEAVAAVPGADRATIQAHQKLGDALNLLGQTDDAIQQWSRALAVADDRLRDEPTDWLTVRDKAKLHYALGHTHNRRNDYAAAAKQMEASVLALETALKSNPDDSAILDSLAVAYSGQADVWWLTGQVSQAMSGYRHTAKIDEQILERQPDNQRVRSNLLHTKSRMGYVFIHLLHEYESGEQIFRDLIAVAEEQLKRTPNDPDWQRNLHANWLDLSVALERQCRFEEAEAAARQVFEPLTKAAAAEPDNGMAQRDLSTLYTNIGCAQLGAKRFAEAVVSFTKSLDILESVASRANRVALVEGDLPPVCICLFSAYLRTGNYTMADIISQKMIQYMKNAMGPSAAAPAIQQLTASNEESLQALKLFPGAERESALLKNLPREAAVKAHYYRLLFLASSGQIAFADRELKDAQKQFPDHMLMQVAQAIVDGEAVRLTENPTEQQRRLESGTKALIAAIRLDRNGLALMHLIPETAPIRKSPQFREQLAKLIADSGS